MAARMQLPPFTTRGSPRSGAAAVGTGATAALLTLILAGGIGRAADRNPILGVDIEPQAAARLVHIRTQTAPTFTVFRLSDPMRVVVDISGGDVSKLETPIAVEDGVLGQIAARQFSADGFHIGRIIVGFEKDTPYEVYARGNAVVVSTGEAPQAAVGRMIPPPTSPVDQATAARLEQARADAEAAAARAKDERRAAEEAAARARAQQDQAQRLAIEAERRIATADAAKIEAERLRAEAVAAAEKDRTSAQAALSHAEEQLRLAEEEARKVESARAEAERIAAQARRTQSEAEQAAAEAEARAKQQLAEVEERMALAHKEQRAAEEARLRANRAKAEAEAAHRAAENARKDAERIRAETTAKLEEITAREVRIETERRALTADKARLAGERRALQARAQELEAERARQGAAQAAAERERKTREAAQATEAQKRERTRSTGSAAADKAVLASASAPAALVPAATTRLRCSGVRSRADAVLIHVDGTPEFETQRLDDPPRLVIDLKGTTRASRRTSYTLATSWARRLRLGDHPEMTRAVIDLASSEVETSVAATREGITVSAKLRTAARDPLAPAAEPALAGAGLSSAAGGPSQVALVRDVRFERRGKKACIVIDLAGAPTALVDDRSSKSWVLQLRETRVAKELERSLDTTAYETVVRLVSTYQASESPPVVNIVASLAGGATQHLAQEGQILVWEIDGESARAPITAAATPQTAGFATEATVLAHSTPRESRQKRVNMRLKDADLVNVIRFIADVTGENIIVAEDVKGKVTVNLRNVPWEQALDTILKSRGYDKVRQNNIIRIATADEIQREREREVAKRKAQVEAGETVIRMIPINYAIAKEIVDQLKPMLSPRGSIQVDDRTNTLILEDLRENIQRIIELARRLDRQTPQVLIEARIVEASSNFEQELGIQWGGVGQASSGAGNPTGLGFPADVIATGIANDAALGTAGLVSPNRFAVNLPATIGAGAGGGIGFIFGSAGGSQLLSLRLSALERNGSGRIISSPRIATLDNRTAKIAQGIDIPISTVSAAGTNTRFVPANLELEVTPHVTNDGTVLLRLKTSKNEPDFGRRGAGGDPTIVKKSAETEVMVRDGDTAVIGGIYTRNTSESFDEVPLFAKIPVLGWLFKKRRNEDRRAELLVFITPRIVNRESALASETAPALTPSGEPPAAPTEMPPQGPGGP